jgi:hypothetical protein
MGNTGRKGQGLSLAAHTKYETSCENARFVENEIRQAPWASKDVKTFDTQANT